MDWKGIGLLFPHNSQGACHPQMKPDVVIRSTPTKFQFLAASRCQSDHSGFNLNTDIRWKSTHDGTHVEENPFELKVFHL